jgi:hypothetical protein
MCTQQRTKSEELFMRSSFHDLAFGQHQLHRSSYYYNTNEIKRERERERERCNLISVHNRRQTMGNDQSGSVRTDRVQSCLNCLLRVGVQSTRCCKESEWSQFL